jgi:arsenite methyltransferase
VDVEPWRIYAVEDAKQFLGDAGLDAETISREVDGKIASAFIRATKSADLSVKAGACCEPGCCA